MSIRHPALAIWVALVIGLSGCADDLEIVPPSNTAMLPGTVVVAGLDGPTQLAVGDDGEWYVSLLAGAENDSTGQVVRLDPDDLSADPVVVIDGLDKPTGVAVFADQLWVMERRRLTRGPLDGSERTVVVDDMAFNGRSQGSLTVDGERLLFDTSGSLSRLDEVVGSPQSASGVLWSVDANGEILPVATGFKHAYAQTRSSDGTLWTTELADGRYDDLPAPDEVVAVVEGADHGWPTCVGDNRPVVEFGGTAESCASVPRSHVLFELGATPTSIVVAPWDDDRLIVALWNRGEVVSMPIAEPVTAANSMVVFDGAARPQHLVVDEGRVLLTDFASGQIFALQPE